MGKKSVLYLYHVNSLKEIKKCITSFENGSPKLYTAKEDGFWAGDGMYFWDNPGNAQYWLRHTKKEHPVILEAKVIYNINDILDLTDKEVLASFYNLWPMVAQKFNVNPNVSLGKKINTITRAFDGKIKLVKELGLYPALKEDKFLNLPSTNKMERPHVTSTVRTIYCVKEESVLSELKILGEV